MSQNSHWWPKCFELLIEWKEGRKEGRKEGFTDDFGVALVRIHQIERMFVLANQIGESVQRQHFRAI